LRVKRALALTGRAPAIVRTLRRGGVFHDSYRAEWEAVIRLVRAGGPTHLATLQDGRAAVAIALAAQQSTATGAPVRVQPPPTRTGRIPSLEHQ
jgi:myo-inositol 2-dehydrogenase/D-chiro-inositol 1-dehydrogenase